MYSMSTTSHFMNEKNMFVVTNSCDTNDRRWNLVCMLYNELFTLCSDNTH